MAWGNKDEAPKTKHTCGGPSFGRLTAGCPRCDELSAGAAPRRGFNTPVPGWDKDGYYVGDGKSSAKPSHSQSEQHLSGGCGPVCTNGDW